MGFIYGAINTKDQPLDQLSDADVLGDIVRVSQALNIGLYALADDKEPNRGQMALYSPVASKGDNAALIEEARKRAPASGEIREFLAVVDAAITSDPKLRPTSDQPSNFALTIAKSRDPVVTQYLPRNDGPRQKPLPEYIHS